MKKKFAFIPLICYHIVLCCLAFLLVSSPKQCNAQTRADFEKRLINLENAVFGVGKCEVVKGVAFCSVFSEVKLKACSERSTPKLKIKALFLFREKCVIAYPPINKKGAPQAFSVKIFGKVLEDTYSEPTVILLKRGKKFQIL